MSTVLFSHAKTTYLGKEKKWAKVLGVLFRESTAQQHNHSSSVIILSEICGRLSAIHHNNKEKFPALAVDQFTLYPIKQLMQLLVSM